MLRRRGAWSAMNNISDRDIAISLLRSAEHVNVLDRNVDLILSSKIKIDLDGNVVELARTTLILVWFISKRLKYIVGDGAFNLCFE
jgi:hypothetical protein